MQKHSEQKPVNRKVIEKAPSISIVIPTYNRGKVLIDTLQYLLRLSTAPDQIIVVDQTVDPSSDVKKKLKEWHHSTVIDWIVLPQPSVVAAMNVGLQNCNSDYVLFLDDDIQPIEGLIENYLAMTANQEYGIIAGRVIQPWDNPDGDQTSEEFSFNSRENSNAPFFIGANVLVNRRIALELGGFDENFKGTAHDYEREFSDRVLSTNYQIGYCGSAAVFHLKEQTGGIRTYGHFLKTIKPHHAVGAYYYILRSKRVKHKARKILSRLRQRVVTRTHLTQPWWIPLTLVGDFAGIVWALALYLSGPALLSQK